MGSYYVVSIGRFQSRQNRSSPLFNTQIGLITLIKVAPRNKMPHAAGSNRKLIPKTALISGIYFFGIGLKAINQVNQGNLHPIFYGGAFWLRKRLQRDDSRCILSIGSNAYEQLFIL
ncbi:hypothetical protein MNBD_CHLOROFLEXI01-1784 [hydrothermal vent metagenome]|uniref:Uncharacterized protein n=1 Tax=hydrothermal vent metagenome TaxID=652676 RepID=A0A3B0WIP0_9ZZZZ